ncbi:MAG TPA: pyruvate dehydrogenase complex dihydrolipoamide acetyltransferase [Polyangiaceae bacterium]|nr:pyruvate dehydrogenase complex dihydrolipoamide acetyltransferase [Polyangiaceae bacterium]
MAKILDMPKLSPTMEEGQLASWHKKEGDSVDIDELLAEVETDKATMEFRSFDRGTILKILVQPGSMVRLGQPVAILGNPGEDISALLAQVGGGEGAKAAPSSAQAPAGAEAASQGQGQAAQGQGQASQDRGGAAQDRGQASQDRGGAVQDRGQASQDRGQASQDRAQAAQSRSGAAQDSAQASQDRAQASQGRAQASQGGAPASQDTNSNVASAGGAPQDGRVKASPYVRKLAREQGLDLHGVEGSGPAGRVVARDLANLKPRPAQPNGGAPPAPEAPRAPAPAAARGPSAPGLRAPEAKPLSMMRKTIARRLTESKQTVPHFYLTIDVDAEALVALRETINRELAKGAKGEPEKVSVNDLLVKACAIALRREPQTNAQYTPEAILYHTRVDISVAVAVAEGLLTPVVRDADLKSVVAIGREVRELAAKAREKKLSPEEMSDGTFSISNLGMFGIDEFSAVINPPEGAILAVGRVRDEPVVREGAIVPGKRLAMTLSCDHRVVDGAVGARFLAELRRLLEQPMQILVG